MEELSIDSEGIRLHAKLDRPAGGAHFGQKTDNGRSFPALHRTTAFFRRLLLKQLKKDTQ